MLDDTAIREFFLRDYPRLVNAEAFITNDPGEAPDTIRASLRRAWERADRGDVVEPLSDWVLADVMGRRWWERSRGGGATATAGVFAGLDRWQRRVASLCLYLRRTPADASRILRMREADVMRALDAARGTLGSSLPRTDHERETAELDDAIERWLVRAERTVAVDGLFDRTLRERERRSRGRRAVTLVLSLVLVAAVAAGFLATSPPAPRAGERSSASTVPVVVPSLDPPPADAAAIPGTSLLACETSKLVAAFEDLHGVEGAYVYQQARKQGPCAPANIGASRIAIIRGDHLVSVSLSGPIQCFPTCRVFSAPRFGGGPALLAIAVTEGQSADAIELYRVREGRSSTVLTRVATVVNGHRIPVAFDWGGVGIYRLGADCIGASRDQLDIWTAVLRRGRWMVQEQVATLHGSHLGAPSTHRSIVRSVAELPSGGRDEFCGAAVRR